MKNGEEKLVRREMKFCFCFCLLLRKVSRHMLTSERQIFASFEEILAYFILQTAGTVKN